MILPFSVMLNNRQTYFVEKILACRRKQETAIENFIMTAFAHKFNGRYELNRAVLATCYPKLHSMREDSKNRWRAGIDIHPFINNRQKNKMLQFVPKMPCKSTQHIIITSNDRVRSVIIDGKIYASMCPSNYYRPTHPAIIKLTALAHNDGFDTLDEFFNYFTPNFSGKIIHWTDLKYEQ